MPSLSKTWRGFDQKASRGGSRRRQNGNRAIPDLAGKPDAGLKDLFGFPFLFRRFLQESRLDKLREHVRIISS
jgi:hypothetical protein